MVDDRDSEPPIDFRHLAEQTFGSADLEREVLRLFLSQSRDCVERLTHRPDAGVAHLLLGSARGIGARVVERAAAALEAALLDEPGGGAAELTALVSAVEAANRHVEARLGAM